MIRKNLSLFLLILLFPLMPVIAQPFQKQANTIPVSFRISAEEMRLYRMINDYRRRYDLPPIPLSVSLCYVASAHVKDLFFHHPDREPCNFHSWSDKGPWKAFCYPRDENKKNSVWDKPKEFTPYKEKGYEIVYWENNPVDIDSIMNLWKSVGYFNSFLMNTGKWQGRKWEAIGIGIYENYACAWFGQIPDPNGPPLVVGETAMKNENPDTIPLEDTSQAVIMKDQKDQKFSVEAALPPTRTPAAAAIKYNIIVRTNVSLKDSAKVVRLYSEKGYPASKCLVKEGKGRISVFETFNKTDALAKLKEVKAKYHDAWLLKN